MLRIFFVIMFVDDSDVLIQSEDRACEQERLRHIIQQPASDIIDLDHLIRHQCDTAHDEQYRTGVLRDFETFFRSISFRFSFASLFGCFAYSLVAFT